MKKLIILGLLVFLTSPTIAQNTERRTVGDYDKVTISGWFDVELIPGEEGEITLQGKESVLQYIDTEVIDGRLKIEWAKRYNINPFYSFSKVQITIPIEAIESVALSGSGSIKGSKTLIADQFTAHVSGSGRIDIDVESKSIRSGISGSGEIILSGKTGEHYIELSGSGDIEAYDLDSEYVNASISGSADADVRVSKGIKARISGSGDINYIGSPDKIDSKVSGSGSVSKGKLSQ